MAAYRFGIDLGNGARADIRTPVERVGDGLVELDLGDGADGYVVKLTAAQARVFAGGLLKAAEEAAP